MNLTVGTRVWWHHTDECRLFGTVEVLEERPGVRPDGDPDLLYLDADQLHVGTAGRCVPAVHRLPVRPARLSPRGAKRLLEPGGPAKFQWERTQPAEHKPHFDFGRLVHLFVLGEGDQVALIDADGYTTKYAREQRDKAHADGLIPALRSQIDEAAAMASAVRQHPIAGPLLAEGDAEHWLYATEPETGQGLRMRLDWMTQKDRLYVVEYKTCADADPRTFARKSYDYGYHLAAAFAVTCARALELDDSPAYLVIAQEKVAAVLSQRLRIRHGRIPTRQAADAASHTDVPGVRGVGRVAGLQPRGSVAFAAGVGVQRGTTNHRRLVGDRGQ
jgi:hypothetical protein